MSSHYTSSHYGGSHYLSSHYGRLIEVEVEEEGSTAGLGLPSEPRRRERARRDEKDLIAIILAFMEVRDD